MPLANAMCPQGFGADTYFPPEWKIPKWPTDMTLETAAQLRTVSLGGFAMESINEEYLEGPGAEFMMQGHETYWQSSGKYLLYFCARFLKWRIAEISAFGKNMEGNCFAFASDGTAKRDIQDPALIKGWIEVQDGQWVARAEAGVVRTGRLGDQFDTGDADDEASDEAGADCDADAGGTDGSPFAEKKSNCPVMPAVRKAKAKIVEAGRAAGKWMRRLFPKVLGAPDEEDAIPEDDPLFDKEENGHAAGSEGCDPLTRNGCSFKEKFYIEKQANTTVEQREAELKRLAKMEGAVMKPDQKDWLVSRISILQKLVAHNVEL